MLTLHGYSLASLSYTVIVTLSFIHDSLSSSHTKHGLTASIKSQSGLAPLPPVTKLTSIIREKKASGQAAIVSGSSCGLVVARTHTDHFKYGPHPNPFTEVH